MTKNTTENNKKDADIIFTTMLKNIFKDNWHILSGIIVTIFVLIFVEVIFLTRQYAKIPKHFDDNNSSKNAKSLLAFYLIMGHFSVIIFTYIIQTLIKFFKPRMLVYLKKQIINCLFKNKEKDIDNGEYLSRLNRIIDDIMFFIIESLHRILPMIFLLFFIAFYMLYSNPLIGITLIINIIAVILVFITRIKKQIEKSNNESTAYHDTSKSMNNIINNVETILLTNNEQKYKDELANDTKKHMNNLNKILLFNNDSNFIASVITLICFSVIIYVIFKNISLKKIKNNVNLGVKTGATMFIMIFFINQMLKVIFRINYHILTYVKIKDSLKYFDIDDVKPSRSNFQAIDPNNTSINIQNLSIKRGNKLIFQNFNLSIPHRHKLAIFGKSGRGKSTLMKAIMGIVHPVDGSIQVSGHDLKTYNLVNLRSKIVFIGQDTVLLNKNIVDNMMEGNSATKAEVIELLTKYQLDKVFQNGINTMVEQNGNNLSKGMQKVIFMVRGLLRDGYIYLIDEPTTSLDPETKTKVIKMIADICKDKTIMCVSHDPDIKKIMDETIEL